ncbi:MAG: Hsp20/alpha crystallin family protein [Burkholderiales bacterium]|nr:Hsp20/alpha crystallin family protein [Burkholderiales bacterium]
MNANNQESATPRRSGQPEPAALVPPVDVIEDAAGITLFADVPGVPKDRLNVRVDGDTLIIEGEMLLDIPRDMEATHVEVSVPRYRRVFTLSRDLDTENMSAELRHGVLKLRISKAEAARPRRIEVRAE